jgi:NADH:ubiquinone oxidoreductase subunit F (NADH-binding)
MGELINDICGGLKPGRTLKAVIPGGSSAKVLKAGRSIRSKGKAQMARRSIRRSASRISSWTLTRSLRSGRWLALAA